MKLLDGLGHKKSLTGYSGKRNFWAKKINHITLGKIKAVGVHGKGFGFVAYKSNHKTQLVMKKYRAPKSQTYSARRDFEVMKKLKELGLSVPPTVRLVEYKGREYLLMTDLSKYGNLQLKYNDQKLHNKGIFPENNFERIVGKKASQEIYDQMNQERKTALENGIRLGDSWEIVINTHTNS